MTNERVFEGIRAALDAGNVLEAHQRIEAAFTSGGVGDEATLFYLQGRAYMKEAQWGKAMSSFLQAERLDPASPARECRSILADIMDFYHKDMYNQ